MSHKQPPTAAFSTGRCQVQRRPHHRSKIVHLPSAVIRRVSKSARPPKEHLFHPKLAMSPTKPSSPLWSADFYSLLRKLDGQCSPGVSEDDESDEDTEEDPEKEQLSQNVVVVVEILEHHFAQAPGDHPNEEVKVLHMPSTPNGTDAAVVEQGIEDAFPKDRSVTFHPQVVRRNEPYDAIVILAPPADSDDGMRHQRVIDKHNVSTQAIEDAFPKDAVTCHSQLVRRNEPYDAIVTLAPPVDSDDGMRHQRVIDEYNVATSASFGFASFEELTSLVYGQTMHHPDADGCYQHFVVKRYAVNEWLRDCPSVDPLICLNGCISLMHSAQNMEKSCERAQPMVCEYSKTRDRESNGVRFPSGVLHLLIWFPSASSFWSAEKFAEMMSGRFLMDRDGVWYDEEGTTLLNLYDAYKRMSQDQRHGFTDGLPTGSLLFEKSHWNYNNYY